MPITDPDFGVRLFAADHRDVRVNRALSNGPALLLCVLFNFLNAQCGEGKAGVRVNDDWGALCW